MTTPEHYQGDGSITCSDAMRSMLCPIEGELSGMQVYWLGCAFKYVWRWHLKGGVKDIDKAIDCLEKLKELS